MRPAPRKLESASASPATTGRSRGSPRSAAASGRSSPSTTPARISGGSRSAASPTEASACRSGGCCPTARVARAAPLSRRPSHSQALRYQLASPAARGSCRSSQSAFGRMPNAQPRSPRTDSSSAASLLLRESSQPIAGRVGRPVASAATSVGPCPTAQIATTSNSPLGPRKASMAAAQMARHQASGSCSARPVSASTSTG